MPPAFNLSQDQTLSFDLQSLDSLKRNRSERLTSLCACASFIRPQHHTPHPTQHPKQPKPPKAPHPAQSTRTAPAHAYRLLLVNEPLQNPAAISRALYYDTDFVSCRSALSIFSISTLRQDLGRRLSWRAAQSCRRRWHRAASAGSRGEPTEAAQHGSAVCHNRLTMTYFHTGDRTIIGAKAFHCPVRDGKEWSHLAMVVRHNRLGWGAVCSAPPFTESNRARPAPAACDAHARHRGVRVVAKFGAHRSADCSAWCACGPVAHLAPLALQPASTKLGRVWSWLEALKTTQHAHSQLRACVSCPRSCWAAAAHSAAHAKL